MRKVSTCIVLGLCALSAHLWAVPARPDWITMTQPDGSTIELRLVGDEYYHYWINQDGAEMVQNDNGWWTETPQQLTAEQHTARALTSVKRDETEELQRAPVSPLPTKMLVILINYTDVKMQSSHTNAFFSDILNKVDNPPYGSVRDYFIATSDGKYTPYFDVFGPIELSHPMAYYGGNDSNDDDQRPREMIWEACQKADSMGCNFANYDGNSDGIVDNVYVIYAGYAESSGGGDNTIWPHSWTLSGISTNKLDGKSLYKYGCSAELDGASGTEVDGIGTFCHEFSHVIGMPDYYDTNYGYNYSNNMTPRKWSLMDYGSYNGNGQRPPLYSIFDKCYMGWATMPDVLAKDAQVNVTMPVGSQYTRHITGTTSGKNYTSTDTIYYLENRQQIGNFDGALPGHGLLIWKVVYKSSWSRPNNDAGAPRYTIVSATGSTTGIGTSKDPFPGTQSKTQKTLQTGCALSEIKEDNSTHVISFKYNGGQQTQFDLTWSANGSTFTTTQSYSSLLIPTNTPKACASDMEFYGWTRQTSMQKDGSDLTIANNYDAVSSNTTYYAVYRTTSSPTRYTFLCDNPVYKTNYDYFEMVQGQSYTWKDQTYNTAGTYINDTTKTIHGDVLDALQLSYVNPTKAIVYTGPNKLDECTWNISCGLHTNAFDQSITLHYFSNGIGAIIFADTLRSVGDYAFYGCREGNSDNKMVSITLPTTVTSIGSYAFYCCYELTDIDMGTSVKTIGEKTFYKCFALKELTLPESLNSLNKHALQKCTTLVAITSEALTPPSCYSSTFSEITRSNIALKVYPISLAKYQQADEWKKFFLQTIPCDAPLTNLTQDTICQGEKYIWKGQTLTQTTVVADSTKNKYGCTTAIDRLELQVMPKYAFTLEDISCNAQPYIWHNQSLTQTGIYYDSLQTIYGCDSVYTLDLLVTQPSVIDTTKQTINTGESYLWREQYYQQQGTYTDTVFSEYGCVTAIYYLELTVLPATPTGMEETPTPVEQENSTRKVYYREQLYIERNGVLYDATGRKTSHLK